MPLRNRVTPFNRLQAVPARGDLMGDRGVLHDADRKLGSSTWKHKRWVACNLSFKSRRRVPMSPGRYTELFFLDEAVSLAAGHRPCCECRRADAKAFVATWLRAKGLDPGRRFSVDEIDADLHASRVTPDREQKLFSSRLGDLPDSAFVRMPKAPDQAWLAWRGELHRWAHDGYVEKICGNDDAIVDALTPFPTVEVLRAGYVPRVHASIANAGGSTR